MSEQVKHWSRITEAGTVVGMQSLLLIYRVFGRWGFRICLFPVIAYYYLTSRSARLASQQYLVRLEQHFSGTAPQSSFQHFLMFGEVLLDKLLVWMGHIKHQDVSYVTDGYFTKAVNDKQGGIIVVSHLGNTEICNALVHKQPNIKVTILVYTKHTKKFNALMKRVGHGEHVEMYQVTDLSPAFAMMMADRVKEGEYLVIAADRTPVSGDNHISYVDFLGYKAAMPQGAFILAGLLQCPIFLMFCLKQGKQYQIHMERFSEGLKWRRQDRAQKLTQTVQNYALRLEHYCRIAPLQWFNFFPFWESAETKQVTDKEQREAS